MNSIARVGLVVSLLLTLIAGSAWAAGKGPGPRPGWSASGWPKPAGHDTPVEGEFGFLRLLNPYADFDLLYEGSGADDDGLDDSNALAVSGVVGLDANVTDWLTLHGAVRTGNDHRESRIRLGGGNLDQNIDVSISRLGFTWAPEVPLADEFALAVGRQPLGLPVNELYSGTVYDEDLVVDGARARWDCGCGDDEDDPSLLYGVGVGGYKLARYNNNGTPAALSNGFNDETAHLLTANGYADWRATDIVRINPFINYSRYYDLENENGNQPSQLNNAQIVDHPEIIHAGLNTTVNVLGTPLTVSGEYINNLDADDEEQAWTAGVGLDLPACDRLHRVSVVYQDVEALSVVPGYTQDDHRTVRTGYEAWVLDANFNTTDWISYNLQGFFADPEDDALGDEWRVRFGIRARFP